MATQSVFVVDADGFLAGSNNVGFWSLGQSYKVDDVVLWNGNSYICQVNNKNIPPNDPRFWSQLPLTVDVTSAQTNATLLNNQIIINRNIQLKFAQTESAASHDESYTELMQEGEFK